MTEHIEEVFQLLGESEGCESALKIALHSMTMIVRKLNKTLIDLSSNQQLGYDVSVRLSERTNEYFTKLLGQWLVSDSVASYFVFDLGGFEFLLDTIGLGSEGQDLSSQDIGKGGKAILDGGEMIDTSSAAQQNMSSAGDQQSSSSKLSLSLGGSDLAAYLESRILEFQ